jgi:hypothetical protein
MRLFLTGSPQRSEAHHMTENEQNDPQQAVPQWLVSSSSAVAQATVSVDELRAIRAQVVELTDAVRALTASVDLIGRITRTRLETLALLAMTSSPR